MFKFSGFSLVLCCLSGSLLAQELSLTSPDNNVRVVFQNLPSLSYTLTFRGKTIVNQGRMGFEFKNEAPMEAGFEVLGSQQSHIDETWKPVVRSKHALVRNQANVLEIQLQEKTGARRLLNISFRAYNDGLAFRYGLFRGEEIGNRQITRELTTFNLAAESKAWIAEYGSFASSNESEFTGHGLDYMQQTTIAALPFLVEVDKNTYAAITEAGIVDYPGFYLGLKGRKNTPFYTIAARLSPLPGEGEEGVKVRFSDKIQTPWRVVMLADAAGKLIESEILQNLSPPCAIADPSWIKPGMCAWDNWWSGDVKMEMPVIKKYIDFAAAESWPYMLVDWQWYGPFNKPGADITRAAPQINMPELISYAGARKVRLWVWLYSSDVNRNNNFEKAFAQYEKWGLAGVKIDFMDRDDQEMVNWYHEIIASAARHHLLLDFHGAYKPDGTIRTWPNLLTREGVMGEEYSKFSNRVTPEHNVNLAFTRLLAGQMDYTPGAFLNVRPQDFKQSSPTVIMNTRAAELSKFVIYESPLTVFCDHPDNVRGMAGEDFLRLVPTTWDDIHFMEGGPDSHIILAKRSGRRWFLGGMTNSRALTTRLDLRFLPAGSYRITLWEDGPDSDLNPKALQKHSMKVEPGQPVEVKMASGGGFAALIEPEK